MDMFVQKKTDTRAYWSEVQTLVCSSEIPGVAVLPIKNFSGAKRLAFFEVKIPNNTGASFKGGRVHFSLLLCRVCLYVCAYVFMCLCLSVHLYASLCIFARASSSDFTCNLNHLHFPLFPI